MVLNGSYRVFVEEVSLAGMPKPSLQGQVFAPAKPAFPTSMSVMYSWRLLEQMPNSCHGRSNKLSKRRLGVSSYPLSASVIDSLYYSLQTLNFRPFIFPSEST